LSAGERYLSTALSVQLHSADPIRPFWVMAALLQLSELEAHTGSAIRMDKADRHNGFSMEGLSLSEFGQSLTRCVFKNVKAMKAMYAATK
jgi:hypothetical protein